jgi:hypothetical protein
MKANYACLGIQRAAKQSHVCLVCLSIFSPHPSRFHSSSARSLCCRFSVAPDANAYACTSIRPLSHVSLSLSSSPFRVFHHCIKKFSSSSASPPSPARLSAAPRSRRSCRRHPSSPPTSASRRSASRLPLPWSSLLSCVVSFLNLVARMLDLRVCVPSTGKSSNSSSSSSCAPGFCGWRGWLVSFESETTALVVFWLPCAAPDMV